MARILKLGADDLVDVESVSTPKSSLCSRPIGICLASIVSRGKVLVFGRVVSCCEYDRS